MRRNRFRHGRSLNVSTPPKQLEWGQRNGPSITVFRAMRLAAGLSQRQLAERLGLTRSAVSRIDHGSRDTPCQRAAAWAAACGYKLIFVRAEHDEAMQEVKALEPEGAEHDR